VKRQCVEGVQYHSGAEEGQLIDTESMIERRGGCVFGLCNVVN